MLQITRSLRQMHFFQNGDNYTKRYIKFLFIYNILCCDYSNLTSILIQIRVTKEHKWTFNLI